MRYEITKCRTGVLALVIGGTMATSAQAEMFFYTGFGNTTGLSINGTASVQNVGGNDVLVLTPPSPSSGGSVFSTQALGLTDDYSFSTRFTFNIGENGETPWGPIGADGLAFVVQTVSNSVGSAGGSLGYGGINPSVAVEFDTYSNRSDPDFNGDLTAKNHIAIMQNGDTADHLKFANVSSALQLSGGNDITAFIDYNGGTNLMEVRWSTDGLRPAGTGLAYTIDLANLFGTNPVYVGFTGATGTDWSRQSIVNWSFIGYYDPIAEIPTGTIPAGSSPPGAVPEPATWLMMIAGFGMVGGTMRRRGRGTMMAVAR